MPTWCHMFNSTLTGSTRREGESTKDFVHRFKVESRDVKEAPKIMRISGFMHGITKPEGEVETGNQEWKNSIPPWKQQEARHKHNFKKRGFKTQQRELRHNTDECMHLKRQIEELLKNGKLSHVIRELKQNSGKDQPKENKKGETSSKYKALAIMMASPKNKESDGSGYCPLIGFSGEIIWPLGQLSLLKYYAKSTNKNLRTSLASSFANKKPDYVKSVEKKEDKKADEKKRDMSKVLSDSDESSSSAEETVAAVAYYTSESESESNNKTLEYYDNSTNYGLFVNDNDDQEIFQDAIESASENFTENHIDSQKGYNKSE
nr:reverse transcriptase domain-containing protein [Tanacetum cinerariifolium]